MVDLELTRSRANRRLYELDRVGSLQLTGFWSRAAIASAAGREWRFARRGMWQRGIRAVELPGGGEVGSFQPRDLRRGGTLQWAGREFAMSPASSWRDRFALMQGTVELAVLDGKGWGRRPVRISAADPDTIDPGLLLFATFVVHGLAEDSGSTAAGGASAAVG